MKKRRIFLGAVSAVTLVLWTLPATSQQVASAAAVQAGVAAAVRGAVKLVSFKTPEAVGKNVASGDPIYLGDKIQSGPKAGLQIMLMDETIFTIGADSAIVIDRFIYDPDKSAGKVSAKVLRGVFRFVSGRVAANKPSDMEVKLPNGTIGIRGTSAGGFVRNGVSEVVLLGPGTGNNVGEPGGRIIVSGAVGSNEVDISRVNYGTRIAGATGPTPPIQWDAAKMGTLTTALRSAASSLPQQNEPTTPAPGQQNQPPSEQAEPAQEVRADNVGRAGGSQSIAKQAGQDVGNAGRVAVSFETVGTDAAGGKPKRPSLRQAFGQNDQLAAIQQIKNTLSGITSVAQLNSIGSGVFNFGSTNNAMKFNGSVAASTYDFSYSIDFNSKTHTGSVTINTNVADTGFVTGSGTFNLLADPFTHAGGVVDITEGGPTTHVPGLNANDNRIEVKYRLVNDGGIATRIEHSVNYGEPQGTPTRTLTGSGSNSR